VAPQRAANCGATRRGLDRWFVLQRALNGRWVRGARRSWVSYEIATGRFSGILRDLIVSPFAHTLYEWMHSRYIASCGSVVASLSRAALVPDPPWTFVVSNSLCNFFLGSRSDVRPKPVATAAQNSPDFSTDRENVSS